MILLMVMDSSLRILLGVSMVVTGEVSLQILGLGAGRVLMDGPPLWGLFSITIHMHRLVPSFSFQIFCRFFFCALFSSNRRPLFFAFLCSIYSICCALCSLCCPFFFAYLCSIYSIFLLCFLCYPFCFLCQIFF